MKASVIVTTYNRSAELRETLRSLAKVESDFPWEVIVVDNNSEDGTAGVAAELAPDYPVPMRYVFEKEQGKSPALNAGMAAAGGDVFVLTDDDITFDAHWLNAAMRGLDRLQCDYVGGRIVPRWQGPKPSWLSTASARQRAVIAIADYGDEPVALGRNPPLGCNMAVRRDAIERVGPYDSRVGRKGQTLLGQEQREWCSRARRAGVRGFYLPDMVVHHLVPVTRLNKRYFRRWFYWHGVSRAIMYQEFGLDVESPEDSNLDFSKVPHIVGVPRYLFRTAFKHSLATAQAYTRRNKSEAFDQELWLWFFAGVVHQLARRGAHPSATREHRR